MTYFIILKRVFDVTVVLVAANHCQISLNCSNWHLTHVGYSDFRLRKRRELFSFYSDSSDKLLEKLQ